MEKPNAQPGSVSGSPLHGSSTPRSKWREIRAVALAHQDSLDDAERLAREAVELAHLSEQPDSKAQALADLAEVLKIASRPAEAALLVEQALDLYLRKGNAVMAERTRRSLVALRSHGTT